MLSDNHFAAIAGDCFTPRKVDCVRVNESTALLIDAADLHFGVLGCFRVFDPNGRVVVYSACDGTSSADSNSPLSVLTDTELVRFDTYPRGTQLVDVSLTFSGGHRIEVIDVDPAESWGLQIGEEIIR